MFLLCASLVAYSSVSHINLDNRDTVMSTCSWSDAANNYNGGGLNAWGTSQAGNDRKVKVQLTDCIFTGCQSTGATESGVTQGSGGGVCVWYGSLTMQQCQFISCTAYVDGGGACVQDGELIADGCVFTGCSARGNGGACAAYYQAQSYSRYTCNVDFRNNRIQGCKTQGSYVLYFKDETCSNTFSGNRISNCVSSGASPSVLYIQCQTLTFAGNDFSLAMESTASAIQMAIGGDEKVIDNCDFDNGGQKLNHFLSVNQKGSWKFSDCSFSHIASAGDGGGIWANGRGNQMTIEVYKCTFTNVVSEYSGGAIFVNYVSKFTITECHIESCSNEISWKNIGGGGGVYIECEAVTGEVSGCVFVNNNSPQNGQSLQVMYPYLGSRTFSVMNCTFKSHTTGSILFFGEYDSSESTALRDNNDPYVIDNCTFEGNTLDGDDVRNVYGLVNAKSAVAVTYNECIFRSNTATTGVVSASNVAGTPKCSFVACTFDTSSGTGACVFLGDSCGLAEVSVESCQCIACNCPLFNLGTSGAKITCTDTDFVECQPSGSLISGSSQTVSISYSTFVKVHGGSDGGVLSLTNVRESSVTSCTFTECTSSGRGGAVFLSFGTQSGLCKVENCTFAKCTGSRGQALHLLFYGESWADQDTEQFDVSNCTFSNPGAEATAYYPIFLEWSKNTGQTYFVPVDWSVRSLIFQDITIKNSDGVIGIWSSTSITYDNCQWIGCTSVYGSGGDDTKDKGGGIIMPCYGTNSGSPSFTLSSCVCERCQTNINSLICFRKSMPVENVLLDNCHFTDITATSEAAVFNPLSLAQNVAITSCVFSQCSGKDAAAVLDIVVDSLSFSGNVFKLSVTTSSALHLALNTKSQKLSLTECTFNNSGSSVTGRFISIDDEHQDVEFTKCHFVDIGSESDGGGLKLSLTSEQAQLVAIECEFYGCFCTGSGGAIHGQSTWNIQLDQCTFDSCSCLHGAEQADNTAGGGGLFINDGTSEARLSSCRFINNRSPQNGQSILLVCQGETQFNRISFSSCTFIEHETGSIICFAYVDGGSLAVSNQDYVLTSCVFENNSLSGNSYLDDFGFFNGNSTGVVKYEYCSFINNVGSPRYVQEPLWDFVDSGIIVVSSKCTVFECEFDTCTLTNTVRGGVICVKETQGLVVERTNFTACSTASVNAIANQVTVEVDLCRFDYCISPTAPSVFSVQMINGVNRIDSVVISNCSITSCTGPPNGVFVHVRAISSHFENIKVNNGECPGCSGFVLSLQQGESASFDFCSFANVQMDHVIQGTSTTGGKVQFNNCSFSSITGNAGGVAVNGEYFGDLTLAGCEFTGIISNGAPVAISKITNAILLETSFDGCQSNTDGAGAVYFGNTFTSARVERCLFINNACANKCGQSLHFVLDNAKQYDMSIAFCTFREHNAGVPAIVLLCYAGQRETAYPYTVTLQNCFFQESVTGNLGLAQFLAQDVVYDSCEFTSISSGDNFGSRIVSLHSESALCTLRHCIFNKCTQSSQFSGILYFDVGSKVDVTVEDCEFNTCTSPSSMISVVSACLRSLNIYMSKFIECSCSSDSSAVLFAGMENEWTSYLPDLKFEMNTVTRCEGTSKGSVINFGPPTLSFRGNIFQLNQAGVESCIYVAAGSLLSGDYIFDNCTFDNNKQELSGQFIGLRAPRDLSFAACMFENLRGSNMGGLYIQRQSGGVRLDITGCSFINCAITGYSTGGGGAVFSGDVTLLTIWDSVFNGCKTNRVEGSNMGGGAIFVDASTKEGTIVNCTFVYNENADGMSIKVNAKENNPSRIDISNCTFSAHQQQTVGPIISFVYIEGNTPTTAPYEYRLSTCRFIDITVTENSGVVNIDAQSIVYENSSFVNTVVRRGAASLIVLGANTETCHLEHCHFESVQPSEKGMASLILMSSPLSQLALIESAFLGIYAGSGLISYSNGAKTLADPFFEMAVLTSCNFQDCQADSHVLNLNCQSCSIENNQFNSKSGATAPPLRIAVTNGKSTICNTSFTVSAESPATSLIQLACASGSEIEFYNCCFTHTAGTASGPLYLSMELEGKVTFSQVCFDVDKQFAISNTGSGTISYDGPESSFFGDNCQCWSSIDPTSEPTREPTTETTTETTSSSDPPSSGQTTEETDTPDAGTSKKSNAGLIAGVVIAVLVIIAVIVVLIIILLRRRGDNVTEEEAHSDQEFAEETAPSTNDSASNQAITDWSHTTEDNPLFTAENMSEMDDDNPFGDDFGEGFGGNPIE